ncbi:MAG TPA: DUF3365 domain-containing protein, partial [Sulfurimonas sp.]|nr:DUF3365 domain-containing protein [Sulfurimonas sp.]
MLKSNFVVLYFIIFIYILTMGLYYNQTHTIIIEETEKHIEDILLSRRALSHLVNDLQKKEVTRLKDTGTIGPNYFSKELLSSSYISLQLNKYTNAERKKLGVAPLTFKYASPNPMNPKNLANAYEQNIYNQFNNSTISKYKEILTVNNKKYLYYAIASDRIEAKCLQCHGLPKDAPKMLVEAYGEDNGFGLKIGALSAIISIKAPLGALYKVNDKQFYRIALISFIIFIILYILTEVTRKYLRKKEDYLLNVNDAHIQSLQETEILKNSLDKLYGHVVSFKFNLEGNIIEVSQALLDVSGYKKDEVIGEECSFFKHQDSEADVFKRVWKSLMSGMPWEGELK